MDIQYFSDLKGLTIVAVNGLEQGSEHINIHLDNGMVVSMYHHQDCCESVSVEEICGDESDLVGGVITDFREDVNEEEDDEDGYTDSMTWTFYNISTSKGSVNIRWLGTSNGYYSEHVDVELLDPSKSSRQYNYLRTKKEEH